MTSYVVTIGFQQQIPRLNVDSNLELVLVNQISAR
jgi:hypothetical protein